MVDDGTFTIKPENLRWEYVITKDGKKRYSVYKTKMGNPKKRYEYDRILHVDFPLGKMRSYSYSSRSSAEAYPRATGTIL
jgi:hypothetical protein